MDSPNFNPLDYINQLFPTEQSLSGIDDVIAKMQFEYSTIDENIHNILCGKANAELNGHIGFRKAQNMIKSLEKQITNLTKNAEQTEETVKEITAEIQKMDCAKKNIISSITTLNHLQILIQEIEDVNKLIDKRLYKEILNPMQAILEIKQKFQKHICIPEMKALLEKVEQIQSVLGQQVIEDLKEAFSYHSQGLLQTRGTIKLSLSQLSNACKIISILDSVKKNELIKWFVQLQLDEYKSLFSNNQEFAWLDKIDQRFDWLKSHLLNFEQKFLPIFPFDWKVSEKISLEFCHLTKNNLSSIMSERLKEINVRLLLFAVNKTQHFEQQLSLKFNVKFQNLIGICFRTHFDIFIKTIDQNLAELMQHFVKQSQEPKTFLLPSSGELFIFFKKSIIQCVQLRNNQYLYELGRLFKKYLGMYGRRVLEPIISKKNDHQNFLQCSMSNLQNKVFSNFISEEACHRLTKAELQQICCVLTTAEYCLETIPQLENKLKEKLATVYFHKFDMSEEKELFHRIISNCNNLFVQDLEMSCETCLGAMNKVQWQNISNVGDQSSYISAIIMNFKETIPIIRDNLTYSSKYFIQFCHKFVDLFIPKFIQTLYKCRFTTPDGLINILGCEQLLLDTCILKTLLLNLPLIGSNVEQKAPTSFVKVVLKNMNRAEIIIKIIMLSIQPNDAFIAHILKLLPDITRIEFQNILEMKSVKRFHQIQLMEIFNQQKKGLSISMKV
ncbi:vacuolar protein sorting-associated protein 53 homolog [Episyrphus balteatus]|uniref:vacuolar protein sorting-associated protein 53 homolog n=1 Tax=Episyrphus balteatus TaxID=286459 RepID=UPI0024866CA0|nr:vacuolar protein sorting-associated protein 53 homolog [Episyrphus balteatus]